MDKDLLSCPFCGHAAQRHYNIAENGIEIVKCSNENCFNILECNSDAWNTRETNCPAVDLEALKREVYIHLEKVIDYTKLSNADCKERDKSIARAIVHYFHLRNLIRGAVEPIEGLEEVLGSVVQYPICNDLGFLSSTDRSILLKAAKAYQAMTKGEK